MQTITFNRGDRVTIAPLTEWWASGYRYGTILSTQHNTVKVRLDNGPIVRLSYGEVN